MCTGCFGAVPSLGSEKFLGTAARTERLPSHDRLHAWRPGFRDLPCFWPQERSGCGRTREELWAEPGHTPQNFSVLCKARSWSCCPPRSFLGPSRLNVCGSRLRGLGKQKRRG